MEYLYLPSVQRIKDNQQLFLDQGIQPITHFDLFKNQYIYPELHLLYKKPALFFEYRVAWTNRDSHTQYGDVSVRWHLELENYAQSFDQSKNQARALEVFKYHRLVKALLHGYGGESFSPLVCSAEEPDLNPTTTNVHVFSFSTKVIDDLAEQIRQLGIVEVTGEEVEPTQINGKAEVETENKYQID